MSQMIKEKKIKTAIGMCVVDITKFLMRKHNYSQEQAYAHFMRMELYHLLLDEESGMFLEPNEYLFECCEIEDEKGTEALYDFIKIV